MRRGWQGAARFLGLAAVLCPALVIPSLNAQVSGYGDKATGPTNDKPPTLLNGVGIAQRLNEQLPLSLTFTDDQGKQVQLSSYFGKKPAILALVYYQCPCSARKNSMASPVHCKWWMKFQAVTSTSLSSVSIQRGNRSGRGQEAQLPQALRPSGNGLGLALHDRHASQHRRAYQGCRLWLCEDSWADGKLTQFAHASSIQIVTPEGKMAQYYMGVEYSPKDLRLDWRRLRPTASARRWTIF